MKNKYIEKTIAFIGAGNMAEALINGIISSGIINSDKIIVSDIKKERLSYLENKFHIKICDSNINAVKNADIILLAVKPQQITEVIKKISEFIDEKQLVISIAAGIKTEFIEKILQNGIHVIRCMPNTPVLLGAGAVAVAKGKFASKLDIDTTIDIFSSSGIVIEVDEEKIDAVTALSGSGPAYLFYLSEIFESVGVEMGLSKDISEKLVHQTIYGAGKMLHQLYDSSSQLRQNVTSPGGTTEAAIKFLESNNFSDIFKQAVKAAHKRAIELANR